MPKTRGRKGCEGGEDGWRRRRKEADDGKRERETKRERDDEGTETTAKSDIRDTATKRGAYAAGHAAVSADPARYRLSQHPHRLDAYTLD